ncbi:MAG: hypothetical protein ACI9MC_003531 [Kiritimatiellia bacterium]|jgi:hypothetical protein
MGLNGAKMGIFGIGGALGLALGLALGPWLWSAPSGVATSTETVAEAVADTKEPRSLVCASGPADRRVLRSQWCEAQLSESARRAQMVQVEWPEHPGVEAPEEWVHSLEAVVNACDLPFSVQSAECTEYPCMALVRARDQRTLDENDVRWTTTCPALNENYPDMDVGLDSSMVVCPDGSLEQVYVFYAVDHAHVADAVAGRGQDESDDLVESMRLFSRRLDAVVSTHGCGG